MSFCYNNSKTNLLSVNCLKKDCQAFANPKRYDIKIFLSPIGKPGFKLCRELGGTPELLEFSIENNFKTSYKLDRCLFEDGSFADTDYLLNYYLKR